MLNMSNQFYNYVAKEIIDYFIENNIKQGDKFFLRLDDEKEVLQLTNAMKTANPSITTMFKYEHQHKLGGTYETFALCLNEIKLVVAYTNKKVKADYLALIRNKVSEQEKEWENTSLISIVSEQLDTIPGGSLDLQGEGMPLHVLTISKNLKSKICDSNLTESEKVLLINQLELLIEEHKVIKLSFFDFKDVLGTLAKGTIEDSDYRELGLFQDPELNSFTGESLKKRIRENRNLFETVKQSNEYNDREAQFQKIFLPSMAKKLTCEGWENFLFSEIIKEYTLYEEQFKTKKVEIQDITSLEELILWDRPQSDSENGKKKRNIIVFNPENIDEITVNIKFSFKGPINSLNKKFVNLQRKFQSHTNIVPKGHTLQIKIATNESSPTYSYFKYQHDNINRLGGQFNIIVIPLNHNFFEPIRTNYLLNARKEKLILKNDAITLGQNAYQNTIILNEQNQLLELYQNQQYEITIDPELYYIEEEICFQTIVEQINLNISIDNDDNNNNFPIKGNNIWRIVRESNISMMWDRELSRLKHNTREYYLDPEYKEFFEWEHQWLEYQIECASIISGNLNPINLNLSKELKDAYEQFLSQFNDSYTIPSITIVDEKYHQTALNFLKAYQNEIQQFQNGIPVGNQGIDLFSLGTIRHDNTIYFTPFHPLMIAYKLKIYEYLKDEVVDSVILNRLSPDSLIPFILSEKEGLYRPKHDKSIPLWLTLQPVNDITTSGTNHYLSKVIKDKLKQFIEHFKYLFNASSNAALRINICNLTDDKQVLNGLLKFMITDMISKGTQFIKPIEVTIYTNSEVKSTFEKFAKLYTVNQVEDFTGIKLKVGNYEADDVLRIIRQNLLFYRQTWEPNNLDINYAHLTFFKMASNESSAVQSMTDMKADIALEGLYSSVPAIRDHDTYRSGFGLKGYTIEEENYLLKTAYHFNELAANIRNEGNDAYVKNNTILSRIDNINKLTLTKIMENSHWVTFIDPNVDLEYFNEFSKDDVVVIHYSDQYTSSRKFDAITVTNKSKQYFNTIKEFLSSMHIESNYKDIRNTIQAFNTFNGEWLLRIIGSKNYLDREKLSIVSAIKYTLAYLDHPNIKWIPISLEEVLRVAGVYNLSKSGGIFTAKNLGVTGVHSDDLLLLGLEERENKIFIHFYPVEVKFGEVGHNTLEKAREQVQKTKQLILDTLTKENKGSFKRDFYKNFFVQLLLSNANKMVQGNIWPEKNYKIEQTVIERLLKLDFQITDHLMDYIGKGAIISFRNEITARSSSLENEVLLINYSLEDGFHGITKNLSDIHQHLHYKETDFIKERMLFSLYKIEYKSTYSVIKNMKLEGTIKNPNIDLAYNQKNSSLYLDEVAVSTEFENNTQSEFTKEKDSLERTRIKIGKIENSNKDVFWEYGHTQLANRHLLISGKSGQGKTYFMQCLLLEKSKQEISSIVIDYTDGFLPHQLEDEFVEYLGSKLVQQIVYNNKLPINPFSRNIRDIGGIKLPESDTDIAERVKSVFASVYKTLGIQQLNTLYNCILMGLQKFDNKMNLMHLKALLEEEGSSTALKTLSQLRPFIDRDPFTTSSTINWKTIIDKKGEVFILQLTGYPRDVQLIITEFILWDLWNFSVREGNKHIPMPVLLDEAQNLDHTENSPSARILTEGRKFGWSAWYATQFLKSQLDASELARMQNASQKIYFAPPEQELSTISSSLANEYYDRRYWDNMLGNLKKGQCIVHGPHLKEDGSLSPTQAVIVNISPLKERM